VSNVILQQNWVVQSISGDTVVLARDSTSRRAEPTHLTNIRATIQRIAGNPIDCTFWYAATTCQYDIVIARRN
jgi:hypothetical protein